MELEIKYGKTWNSSEQNTANSGKIPQVPVVRVLLPQLEFPPLHQSFLQRPKMIEDRKDRCLQETNINKTLASVIRTMSRFFLATILFKRKEYLPR